MNRNHSSRTTLVPGAIPTINLPIKSFPSSSTCSRPRQSAQSILQKKIEPVENVITDQYKSFTDFISKTQLLKLVGWSFTYTSDCASFACHDAIHSVPKYEIYVDNNLVFTVRVLLWSVPAKHDIYSQSLKLITITYLTRLIMDLKLCPGLTDHFAGSCLEHCVPKVFNIKDSTSAPLHQSKWYRSPNCIVLIPPSSAKCLECVRSESKESLSLKRKRDNLISPAKLKAPISMTSPDRIIKTLQNHRLENKELKEELKKMQDEISTCAVSVQKSLGDDFIKIMSTTNRKIPPFMKFFWEEQQKYLSSSKTGVRYHPMIIRYCLGLAAKSSAFYDEIRVDDKKDSGFLVLPSRRRLRDYKNYIRPKQGFNKDVIQELCNMVSKFQPHEKYAIFLMDEMKIQESLVWDKHNGDLIGFVDLGDIDLNYVALEKVDEIASHVLVFLVRSIVNPLKFSFANFATTNVTSIQLFPLFWKAVGILEEKCGIKVVGVCYGG
ncbi:uncharacterized protein LOC130613092 [Hydractinia symbiolongicarpus]|uniref:uncharacterized protein LOC130613092 n=1 Tax=Hydractinia symbiolongicarpus TaxID=13093 RepID=UPI00254C8604|nr:uncharacterized protein LOC130613092 [Hydractinia symbiolongicarpus]XP_057290403.1 uncharacterized protein LOC130613092 [Hydractinia symbiolongicarpus]